MCAPGLGPHRQLTPPFSFGWTGGGNVCLRMDSLLLAMEDKAEGNTKEAGRLSSGGLCLFSVVPRQIVPARRSSLSRRSGQSQHRQEA